MRKTADIGIGYRLSSLVAHDAENYGKRWKAYRSKPKEGIGNKALAFVGTSGVQMGWLASQADMLADDWRIVE